MRTFTHLRFTAITLAVTCLSIIMTLIPAANALSVSPNLVEKMEGTVRRYFQGVNDKDPVMIASCFGDSARIRDVCALSQDNPIQQAKTVEASTLVTRCMDFVKAHPDCSVDFYYGPECGRNSHWVVAHWYETGTWSGLSLGLEPNHEPMAVEGQTRFLVDPKTLLIQELVVTRTFTQWETATLQRIETEEEALR
jgi:hypothetical protein